MVVRFRLSLQQPSSGFRHGENAFDRAPPIAARDIDDKVQTAPDFASNATERNRAACAQSKRCQPVQRLFGGTRMNRGQGTAMTGIHRIEQSSRERYQQAMHFVTHEMRTPLSAIQGSSELISRYQLPVLAVPLSMVSATTASTSAILKIPSVDEITVAIA